MKKLILNLVRLLMLMAPLTASAAQLESIIDALAIKSSASHTNNSWEETSKIKGVKWKWPYHESGAHDSTMVGITKIGNSKNPNIGAAQVTVVGARTFITSVQISIPNESVGIDALGRGKTSKIKTTCDIDSAPHSVEFYKLEKPGYKPLFLHRQASVGASGSGSTDLKVSYDVADVLGVQPTPCKVLK